MQPKVGYYHVPQTVVHLLTYLSLDAPGGAEATN